MTRLASTDLERSREWIARAATGLWGSFVRAADCHNEGDEEGEAHARECAAKYDLALTLAVLRYCNALRAA